MSSPKLPQRKMSIPKVPQVDHGTTLNRDDYTEEERINCWYTQYELAQSRARNLETFQRMEAGLKQRTASPYRGLEGEMREVMTSCVNAVMEEQELQRDIEEVDWDRIAQCSMKISAEGIADALQMARKDAREAQKVYQAMDEEQERNTGSGETCANSQRSVSWASKISESKEGAGSAFGNKSQMKKKTKRSKRYDQEKQRSMVPGWEKWRQVLR
jgi:hypothetical protein